MTTGLTDEDATFRNKANKNVKRLKMHKIVLFKAFLPNQEDELGLFEDLYP